MDKEIILYKIDNLTLWKRESIRAPHKPLLLLLTLGILQKERRRLISFKEIEKPLRRLLFEFGPSRKSYHPEYPFWRLQHDGIWEVEHANKLETRKSNTDAKKSELIKHNIRAGLNKDVFDLLINNKELIPVIASKLLDSHFEESLHRDILSATNLSLQEYYLIRKNNRDSNFRDIVLSRYDYKCAVCNYDIRLGTTYVGLEAAHIKSLTAKGLCSITNGIALCSLHHKLFDYGLFTIDLRHRLIVSEKASGNYGVTSWMMNYHTHTLNRPSQSSDEPKKEYLEWHHNQVFKKPAITI